MPLRDPKLLVVPFLLYPWGDRLININTPSIPPPQLRFWGCFLPPSPKNFQMERIILQTYKGTRTTLLKGSDVKNVRKGQDVTFS